MQPQSWITHQGNVDSSRVGVGGIPAGVILSDARAAADGVSMAYLVKMPEWPTRPRAGEPAACIRERGTQEAVGGIPIPKVTSEKSGEDGVALRSRKLSKINCSSACVSSRTASVSPEFGLLA